MKQMLALGAVVKVQVGEKNTVRLVVAGYFPIDERTGKLYDYSAVAYPWGMQPNPGIHMFNAGQIVSVEYAGYMDEDGEQLTKGLPQALEQFKKEAVELLREGSAKKTAETEAAGKTEPAQKKTAETSDTLEEFG